MGLPAAGANIVRAGFPCHGPGDMLNIQSGTISTTTVKYAVKLIEVIRKLRLGMSGGLLMTHEHAFTGIISQAGPTESRNFSVKLSDLDNWVADLPCTTLRDLIAENVRAPPFGSIALA